jgi:hypothetical protein
VVFSGGILRGANLGLISSDLYQGGTMILENSLVLAESFVEFLSGSFTQVESFIASDSFVALAVGSEVQALDSVYSNGIFIVNGRMSAPRFFFDQVSILGGSGLIEGSLIHLGLILPGNSIGTFTINGNLQQTGTSQLLIEVESDNSFDRLVVNGTASLDSTRQLVPLNQQAFVFGDTLEGFLTAQEIEGQFASIVLPEGFRRVSGIGGEF